MAVEEYSKSTRPSVVSLDEVRAVFETNVFGVVAVTQAMLPLLREAPAGRIVNVSSGAGSLTRNSDKGFAHRAIFGPVYPASKTALNAMTLAMAIELEVDEHQGQRRLPGLHRDEPQQLRGHAEPRGGRPRAGAPCADRPGRSHRHVLERCRTAPVVIGKAEPSARPHLSNSKRETAMHYRTLGKTGIKVSPYCLGAMMFGGMGNPDHDDCIRIIHKALDAGVNFIDTADRYSRGEFGGDRRQGAEGPARQHCSPAATERASRSREFARQGVPPADGRRPQPGRGRAPHSHCGGGRAVADAHGDGLRYGAPRRDVGDPRAPYDAAPG